VPIPENTGDFRLINRKVVEHLKLFKEKHGFLRGMVALVGFNQTSITYKRDARATGRSNYSQITGSLKIGLNGIFAFSSAPLTILMALGIFFALIGFASAAVIVFVKLRGFDGYPLGIPTVLCVVLFLGGLQLICMGIIGQYIARIYDETRDRPLYIIDKKINF